MSGVVQLTQIGNVLTHYPFLAGFMLLGAHIVIFPVVSVLAYICIFGSTSYHNCSMMGGVFCPLPFLASSIVDRMFSENLLNLNSLLIFGFRNFAHEVFFMLFATFLEVFIKLWSNTIWFCLAFNLLIYPSGLMRNWKWVEKKWVLATAIFTILAFICYFLETPALFYFHYLWHTFGGVAFFCNMKAVLPLHQELRRFRIKNQMKINLA